LEKCIFIDETGFNISMRRTYGRSLAGTKVRLQVPRLRSKNITVIAAISESGIVHYKVLDGNGNQNTFSEFLVELFTTLNANGLQSRILIMDNASFHKTGVIQELIKENNHKVMYLPPYSPFLNPIEYFFNKWKSYIRSHP